MTSETEYIQLRNAYLPTDIHVVFVAESPPAGHGYIYDPSGKPSELFFRSMMRLLFQKDFETKELGLRAFADAGCVLVNPIYTPVNRLPDADADEMILNNYPRFLEDLLSIGVTKQTPIILIKKNICLLLDERLQQDGYRVLNNGEIIPFPMHYHFETFRSKVEALLTNVRDK